MYSVVTIRACNGEAFSLQSPATIGRYRHVVLCPTDQHTVRRLQLCSPWTAALEQSAGPCRIHQSDNDIGEFRRFCSSDTAAHSDFLILGAFKYSDSLTHSQYNTLVNRQNKFTFCSNTYQRITHIKTRKLTKHIVDVKSCLDEAGYDQTEWTVGR